jgi:hypothetical protein
MIRTDFRVIQGFPAPADIAPYIALLCEDTGAQLSGAYRGADAEHLLLAHGQNNQDGMFNAGPDAKLQSLNPSGTSTHELFSDGEVYPYVKRGDPLEWWQMGWGVNPEKADEVVHYAESIGWDVFQPYPHFTDHLNFRFPPQLWSTDMLMRIINLRDTLPRS